ncbi:unnamed protein product [Adineta steineri]|uniref:G-protein coupled receptors family 1 profile domain-containing protein n=1 Tax=Adineta steineri TaxID=433720 RepID=A0A813MMY9_9BILA|nr:unnamed protein product [Adineta steineri]CAF3945439.1 unnamed protein product [Adineta steineri]
MFPSSFNQPKFCPTPDWNPYGITFANETAIGKMRFSVGFFISTNNTVYTVNEEKKQILMWISNSINANKIISTNFQESRSIFITNNGDIYYDNGDIYYSNGPRNGRVDKWISNTDTHVKVMDVNSSCFGLFVDINNTLYCSMNFNHKIVKRWLNNSEMISTTAAGSGISGSASNQLSRPMGIFVDVNFDLYVADCNNNRIQLFKSGKLNGTTIVGKGSSSNNNSLRCPSGIVLDADKYLFIVDRWNNRIIRSGSNDIRCIIGCGREGSQSHQLNDPVTLSFDSYGNIFITDIFNDRIQKFNFLLNSCDKSSAVQSGYSSRLTRNYPKYSRTGCDLSMYYYEAIQVNVNESRYYTLNSNSPIDIYGFMYTDNFYPFDPSINLIMEDDDSFGKLQFKIGAFLRSTTANVLVVTTASPNVTGTFSVIVSGIHNVTFERLDTSSVVHSIYSSALTENHPIDSHTVCDHSTYYEAIQMTVNKSGYYTFVSNSKIDLNGYMYQDDFNPSNTLKNLISEDDNSCVNPDKCVIGDACNVRTKGIGITLDDILRYEINQNMPLKNQSLLVKISIGLTTVMFLLGLINSILSLLTFQNANLRKVGCGTYLLASSITSLLTISMFTINFCFVLLTQMNLSINLSVGRGGCISIEPLLKVFLYFDTWLNACVAIERAINVYKSVNFNKEKSKRLARWIIFILPFCITATIIHEPLHRNIFDYQVEDRYKRMIIETHRWCVINYSRIVQNYNTAILFIHLIGPFIANLFSALFIIFGTARQRSVAQTSKNYMAHIREQLREHKQLVISPAILLVLAMPRLIISLSSGCVKVSDNPWLYLFAYFISFTSSILVFIIFVVPSELYRKTLKETLIAWQRRIRH